MYIHTYVFALLLQNIATFACHVPSARRVTNERKKIQNTKDKLDDSMDHIGQWNDEKKYHMFDINTLDKKCTLFHCVPFLFVILVTYDERVSNASSLFAIEDSLQNNDVRVHLIH